MDYETLKPFVEGSIPWIKDSGLKVEVLEGRHVVLRLPFERHRNSIGSVYTGSLFMLMEIAGATLFACTYPPGRYIPMTREMHIEFLNMGLTDILCDLFLSEETAREMLKPIEEKGKGEWVLAMACRDTEGALIASSVCHYNVKKLG